MTRENIKKVYLELKKLNTSEDETIDVIRKIHSREDIDISDMGADTLVAKAKNELTLEEKENMDSYEFVTSRFYAIFLIISFIIEDNNQRLVELINEQRAENNKQRKGQ